METRNLISKLRTTVMMRIPRNHPRDEVKRDRVQALRSYNPEIIDYALQQTYVPEEPILKKQEDNYNAKESN